MFPDNRKEPSKGLWSDLRRVKNSTPSRTLHQALVGLFWWNAAFFQYMFGRQPTRPEALLVLTPGVVAGFAFYALSARRLYSVIGLRGFVVQVLNVHTILGYWLWLIFWPPERSGRLGSWGVWLAAMAGLAAMLFGPIGLR